MCLRISDIYPLVVLRLSHRSDVWPMRAQYPDEDLSIQFIEVPLVSFISICLVRKLFVKTFSLTPSLPHATMQFETETKWFWKCQNIP